MNKKEFKKEFWDLIHEEVTSNKTELDMQTKINEIKNYLVDIEIDESYDMSNKNTKWTDEEMKIVLSFAPSKDNCLKLAKAFKRGYGSVEQIFRWSTATKEEIINKGRENDAFVQQIKRVYKEIGWKA